MQNFLEVPFSINNLDRYYIRSTILEVIKKYIPFFRGRLLDVGCGQMPYKKLICENSKITDYVGIDIEDAIIYNKEVKPDFKWDGTSMPFKSNEFDTVIMTEVLEHVPYPINTLKEVHRVLNVGGFVLFTVPFLWPLHETPHDEYRYTPFSMKRIFEQAGFNNIEIFSMGGWNASLAQMLGLWVVRSRISKRKRILLSIIIKPIIRFLISRDNRSNNFMEGVMITGIYGIAKKT